MKQFTMTHWAERFEAARDFIVERWGDRMVIRRPEVRVPDPGLARRLISVAMSAS